MSVSPPLCFDTLSEHKERQFLVNMLGEVWRESYFNICPLSSLWTQLGIEGYLHEQKAHQLLKPYHCKDWKLITTEERLCILTEVCRLFCNHMSKQEITDAIPEELFAEVINK